MRVLILALFPVFMSAAWADSGEYVLNFDLDSTFANGNPGFSIQLQGINLVSDKAFHGKDLGKHDYFLTVSNVNNGVGKLTIEFYEYETRKNESDVVSEIVSKVDFQLGRPTVFEAENESFGVNLAFIISER